MFEAVVLICLWGYPTEVNYCEELIDARGPYISKNHCLDRVNEIKNNMPHYRPEMGVRGYKCNPFNPKKRNDNL